MAIKVAVDTLYGKSSELYIRINNAHINNHGVPSLFNFRGFASQEAFDERKPFLWERQIEVLVYSVDTAWAEAYEVLKADPEFANAVNV